MKNALVGCTGFVGSTLRKQAKFEGLYHSANIGDIHGEDFDILVCAAAPAQKWLANKNPEEDYRKISCLIENLKKVRCERFVLISTVDVFRNPVRVYEDSEACDEDLHPYGKHRLLLEKFVVSHFANHLIVRLPGLVGPGLRKNVVFDFLNSNNLHAIDSRSIYQFYPIVNLWFDIQVSLKAGLPLIHLTAEPVSVKDVAKLGFGIHFEQELDQTPAIYDFRSKYAYLFGGQKDYQYTLRESIQAIRYYAQSEPVAK